MAQRRLNPFVLVVIGIVVLGIVAVVVTSGGGDDGGDDVPQVRPVSVEGDALAPYDPSGEDPAIGAPAPEVSGASFDGSAVRLGKGPAVIVFVAHWCPHCQAEVPRIAEWLAENGAPEGVSLVAVSTSVDEDAPNFPPSAWLAREGLDVPTLADDENGSAGAAYGLQSFPYFVVIGADGTVVERASGEIGTDRLEALLDAARGR